MGDRIQDEGQPQAQDIQALLQRAEQRVLAAATAMRQLLSKTRQQNGWGNDEPGAEQAIVDDPDGARHREDMTGRLWYVIERVWPIQPRLQEIRRRLGLMRDPEKLSDMYHTAYSLADWTARWFSETKELAEKFPEVEELTNQAEAALRELADTVKAVLQGTGMWNVNSYRDKGTTLRPGSQTRSKALKW